MVSIFPIPTQSMYGQGMLHQILVSESKQNELLFSTV